MLAVGAGFGVARIKVDDSLSRLFESNTPDFKQYQDETRRFPSSAYDVLVVIEGKTLLERSSLEKLRNLAIDLELMRATRGLRSLFSAREPPRTANCPHRSFRTNCRVVPPTSSWWSVSRPTRLFATSFCPPTGH
jgi:predicted RND superfamily exporter protein